MSQEGFPEDEPLPEEHTAQLNSSKEEKEKDREEEGKYEYQVIEEVMEDVVEEEEEMEVEVKLVHKEERPKFQVKLP